MTALFHKEVTIVSPLSKDEVRYLIASKTKEQITFDEFGLKGEKISNLYVFDGVISGNRFTISKKSNTTQFFIPIIQMTLETSSRGTIIQLCFRLSYASRVLFFSSSLVASIIGMLFIILGNLSYGFWAIFAVIVNYVISRSSFKMHIRDALRSLYNVIRF